MHPRLQAKLLRVIQEREIDRVGGTQTIPVDVRILVTQIETWKRSMIMNLEKTFSFDLM